MADPGGLPTHRAAALHSGILPYLLGALDSGTFGVRREAVMAVRNACAEGFAVEALLISGGQAVLGHLVEMLGSKDPEVILACLQLIQAMALASPEAKAAVVERCQNLGVSDVLEALQVRFHFCFMQTPTFVLPSSQNAYPLVRGLSRSCTCRRK